MFVTCLYILLLEQSVGWMDEWPVIFSASSQIDNGVLKEHDIFAGVASIFHFPPDAVLCTDCY